MNNTRTIRVTGKGRIKVRPDMTRITLALEGTYPDYDETLRRSSEDTESLKDLLTGFGFEQSDLKTLNFSVDTEYESYKDRGTYGVWFAYGNHDKGYFNSRDFTAAELAQALQENGVHILEDEIAYAGDLCIAGRRDASLGPRSELKSLLNGADTDKFVIVLDHQPTDYEKESQTNADLVVSGHTHGGQMIPLGLIGRWFGGNDRTYGYEKRNGTHFIVTSGISDWAVHFKTGARSEYVIITVTGIGS